MNELERKPADAPAEGLTPAKRMAHEAIRDGEPITYKEILEVKWKPYDHYTPKQNEYALRHLRVERFEAKLEQDAELSRRGPLTPELLADKQKHERTARAMVAADRAWLTKQAGAFESPATSTQSTPQKAESKMNNAFAVQPKPKSEAEKTPWDKEQDRIRAYKQEALERGASERDARTEAYTRIAREKAELRRQEEAERARVAAAAVERTRAERADRAAQEAREQQEKAAADQAWAKQAEEIAPRALRDYYVAGDAGEGFSPEDADRYQDEHGVSQRVTDALRGEEPVSAPSGKTEESHLPPHLRKAFDEARQHEQEHEEEEDQEEGESEEDGHAQSI